MKSYSYTMVLLALAAATITAQAASKHDYTYSPVAGVHEVKFFHGCYDNKDLEKRPKIDVLMNGLATTDVLIETRIREEGKPSTEMITFRLKNLDASLSVQFRSNDGPHCQQGVQRIAFRNATLHNVADLNTYR